MSCEMCGKETPALRKATIEGTVMQVCGDCVRFGVEVAGHAQEVTGRSRVVESLERRAQRMRGRDVFDEHKEVLVPDCADRVRAARERRRLTLEELGTRIAERVSILAKLEAGQHHPSDDLAKRLERELKIQLFEAPEASYSPGTGKKDLGRPATLGDMLRDKLRKG